MALHEYPETSEGQEILTNIDVVSSNGLETGFACLSGVLSRAVKDLEPGVLDHSELGRKKNLVPKSSALEPLANQHLIVAVDASGINTCHCNRRELCPLTQHYPNGLSPAQTHDQES